MESTASTLLSSGVNPSDAHIPSHAHHHHHHHQAIVDYAMGSGPASLHATHHLHNAHHSRPSLAHHAQRSHLMSSYPAVGSEAHFCASATAAAALSPQQSRYYYPQLTSNQQPPSVEAYELSKLFENVNNLHSLQPPPPPPPSSQPQLSSHTTNAYNSEDSSNFASPYTQQSLAGASGNVGAGDRNSVKQSLTQQTSQQLQTRSVGRNIEVSLLDQDIWKRFYEVNNEMIVTKSGR